MIARWLTVAWIALLILSIFSLQLEGALPHGGRVAFDRAVFVATSVGTLTGFEMAFANLSDFSPAVQAILLLQTCSGVLLSFFGGGVLLVRLHRSATSDRALASWTIGLLMVALITGWISSPSAGLVAAWSGVAAVGNMAAPVGAIPQPSTPSLWLVLYPLSLAGVIGPAVLAGVGRPRRQKHISPERAWRRQDRHALAIALVAFLFVTAIALFFFLLMPLADGVNNALRRAAVLALAPHGFAANLDRITEWPRGTEWPLLGLILFGVGTAGAVGGFGPAWLVTLPRRLHRQGLWYVGGYALLIVAGLCALARCDATVNGERLVMLVIGACSNVGVSHAPVSLTGSGLMVLSACMIAGRLLPLYALSMMLERRSGRNFSR
jgi:hypothetical protein